MSGARSDFAIITAGLLAWVGIFWASAQGMLGVSWLVSDGLLALLAVMVLYRIWRMARRRERKDG